MKKFILGLLVFLMLAAGGFVLYVTNIDWNQHKDKIAEQVYNLTGKSVDFEGRLSFEILPSPYLNASNAKIYNSQEKNETPLMEVNNIVAELSLLPLLKGEFHVKKMTLDGVNINILWGENGFSWQDDLTQDQRQMMEEADTVLNSVSLKNATVNFEAPESEMSLQLTNLNGEVFAQSIFGPFRIEGNYLKGNSPEGFALTIGKLSETMPTTLNMVVTHPVSESYVRFDGSFQTANKSLSGNAIIESKKISDFINANMADAKIPTDYNEIPLALGFDVAINPKSTKISNMVIKYGDTQGAGVIDVTSLRNNSKEINGEFNFTDLDIAPLAKMWDSFKEKYKEEAFVPKYPADITLSVKALRAMYQGQGMKNLETDVNLYNDTMTISNLVVTLPGNTDFKAKGVVYPAEGEIYYQFDTEAVSEDLMQTLNWLGIAPKTSISSVYKKLDAKAKIAGNFDKIQISPYNLTLDKSVLSGEAGIILGDRNDAMVVINADSLNLDNYINPLPEEEKNKSFSERMNYRFVKLAALNDFDLILDIKSNLIIYESTPFEKVEFKGNLLNGVMTVEKLNIGQVADTAVELSGDVSGFGTSPEVKDLQYLISSKNVATFVDKFGFDVPKLDYKKFGTMSLAGGVNGGFDNMMLNAALNLGRLEVSYKGAISKGEPNTDYNAYVEIKHPDFATMVAELGADYEPSVRALGPFNAKFNIVGNSDVATIDNLEANVGYTTVAGSLNYEKMGERLGFIGNLNVNKLELDKFIPKSKTSLLSGPQQSMDISFLPKPFWSKDKIDYSPYNKINLKTSLDIGELSYKDYIFKTVKTNFETTENIIKIDGFTALYNETPVNGEMTLYTAKDPTVTLSANIADAKVENFNLGGKIFGIKSGKFNTRFDLSSKADSEESFVNNLKGKVEFNASVADVAGINLAAIYTDLTTRNKTEGLAEVIKSNVASGNTLFDKISSRMILDGGKFSLANTIMQSSNANVNVSAEGNLGDWTMDTVFNVKYNEPKYLPEFTIYLKNSMEKPDVEINIDGLLKLYQAREEQMKEAQEAAVEAEINYWKGLVNEQQKTADDLVLSTREKLEKDIQDKMSKAINPENVNKYNVLVQDIANTLAELVNVVDSVENEKFDEATVEKLKAANQKAIKQIEIYAGRRDEIYKSDLLKQNDKEYAKVVEVHNALKQVLFGYNAKLDAYKERLRKSLSDYKIDDDTQFVMLKQDIDNKVKELEKLNTDTQDNQNFDKNTASSSELQKRNEVLGEVFNQLQNGIKEINDKINKLDEYVEPKIKAAEQKYYEEVQKKEDERILKENTGSISVKKTGQTYTVTRDLEDIKEVKEQISNEEVKVLDFSREKANVPQTTSERKENIIKKGRNSRLK